jgi:hypothetical protein
MRSDRAKWTIGGAGGGGCAVRTGGGFLNGLMCVRVIIGLDRTFLTLVLIRTSYGYFDKKIRCRHDRPRCPSKFLLRRGHTPADCLQC